MANLPNPAARVRTAPACFTCDQEILGAKISLSNSVTTHSSTAIPVKISELMGEDFLVILTGDDYICKRCNVLFNLMDRLQSELSIVQNALLGHIRSKYNLPGMSDSNTTAEIQFSVNGVPYNEFARMNNLQTSQTKLQANPPQSNALYSTPKTKSSHENKSTTTKVYKCGFCDFQSKDLLTVKEHMRGHVNSEQKKADKRLGSPIAPRPIKRKLFRCQVCSESYFDRKSCLNHIKATHTGDNPAPKPSVAGESANNVETTSRVSAGPDQMNGRDEAEAEVKTETEKNIGLSEDTPTTQEGTSASEVTSQNKTELNPISNSGATHENGTSSDGDQGALRSEQVAESVEGKFVDSADSKTIGLDLDAMLAALHSEGSSSEGVPGQTVP